MPKLAKLTKTDMARVVVQALFRLPTLPTETNCDVLALVREHKVQELRRLHQKALDIINGGIAAGTWPKAA